VTQGGLFSPGPAAVRALCGCAHRRCALPISSEPGAGRRHPGAPRGSPHHARRAIRTYGRQVLTLPHGSEPVKSALTAELDAARHLQDRLARLLEPRTAPDGGYSEWPVRGEILCHVDRLRAGLVVDTAPQGLPRRPRPAAAAAGPHGAASPPGDGAGREHRAPAPGVPGAIPRPPPG
jgi:hypothetical protein